jgi:hypothetical protein
MVELEQVLDKFGEMGEKTGWTVISISANIAHQLIPNNKKSFRIKGHIDSLSIHQVALIPIGKGDFILPVNAKMRKGIQKEAGEKVILKIEVDTSEFELSADLLACLEDEPKAEVYFNTLTAGHRRYFSNWIESAKTIETKTKRITQALWGLSNDMGYPEMIRQFKGK